MATQNARPRPFTQPISAMRKNGLQALCRHFELDDDGPVTTLRQLLKTHLQNNRHLLENDPVYTRLYPRPGRGRRPLPNPPDNDQDHDHDHNSHHGGSRAPSTPSVDEEWHGIHQLPDADVNNNAVTANNSPHQSPEPDEPPRLPHITQDRQRSTSISAYTFPLLRLHCYHYLPFPTRMPKPQTLCKHIDLYSSRLPSPLRGFLVLF